MTINSDEYSRGLLNGSFGCCKPGGYDGSARSSPRPLLKPLIRPNGKRGPNVRLSLYRKTLLINITLHGQSVARHKRCPDVSSVPIPITRKNKLISASVVPPEFLVRSTVHFRAIIPCTRKQTSFLRASCLNRNNEKPPHIRSLFPSFVRDYSSKNGHAIQANDF